MRQRSEKKKGQRERKLEIHKNIYFFLKTYMYIEDLKVEERGKKRKDRSRDT